MSNLTSLRCYRGGLRDQVGIGSLIGPPRLLAWGSYLSEEGERRLELPHISVLDSGGAHYDIACPIEEGVRAANGPTVAIAFNRHPGVIVSVSQTDTDIGIKLGAADPCEARLCTDLERGLGEAWPLL